MLDPEKALQEGLVSEEILKKWEVRGVSRRDFVKFCSIMTATLALPMTMMGKVAEAIEGDNRLPVIWVEFQGCTGDSEAFLRANQPTATEMTIYPPTARLHHPPQQAALSGNEGVQHAVCSFCSGLIRWSSP